MESFEHSLQRVGAVQSRGSHLTVQEFVYQDKVVLDGLLVKLAKVALTELDKPVEELEYQGSIGIALCDGNEVNILVLDVAKGGAAERQDRGADLGIGDDLDAKDISEARAAVISEGAKYQVLALLIEYQNTGQHLCDKRLVAV